jgi:hypothetical protein
VLLVKGAAECVLERCDRLLLPDGREAKLTPTARAALLAAVERMADRCGGGEGAGRGRGEGGGGPGGESSGER